LKATGLHFLLGLAEAEVLLTDAIDLGAFGVFLGRLLKVRLR
jgi:hypothetical protein